MIGHKLPEYSLYEFETIADSIQSFGCKAKFLRGRLENQYAGTDVELTLISDCVISKALGLSLIHGLSIEGLPVKYRWTQHNKSAGLGNMKSYMGHEIIDLKENNNLEDSIFLIPTNIKIKNANIASVDGFLKEIGKYLKSNNLYPNQRGEEVTYEIKEEEWDY